MLKEKTCAFLERLPDAEKKKRAAGPGEINYRFHAVLQPGQNSWKSHNRFDLSICMTISPEVSFQSKPPSTHFSVIQCMIWRINEDEAPKMRSFFRVVRSME